MFTIRSLAMVFLILFTACNGRERIIYKNGPPQRDRFNHSETVTSYPLIFAPQHPTYKTLLVVLHGCAQSAETMAAGTQFNRFAERDGVIVLYPQVPSHSPDECWGWYRPENQVRGSGQPQLIIDEVEAAKNTFGMENPRIYVVGISAGGAMVSTLLSCYPEVFKGGAIHSGTPYASAKNETEAAEVLSQGVDEITRPRQCDPRAFSGRLLVIQGEKDKIVNPKNARAILRDFSADKKFLDRSLYANGSDFEVSDFKGRNDLRARLVTVAMLNHAWSGANLSVSDPKILGMGSIFKAGLPFFAANGPSATELVWDYLINEQDTIRLHSDSRNLDSDSKSTP